MLMRASGTKMIEFNQKIASWAEYLLQPRVWNTLSPQDKNDALLNYKEYIHLFSHLTNQFILKYLPGRTYLNELRSH